MNNALVWRPRITVSQMQLKDVSRKPERSQRRFWGDVFYQSPGRRFRYLQISPLWDLSEMLNETSQRCIWDAFMPAGLLLSTARTRTAFLCEIIHKSHKHPKQEVVRIIGKHRCMSLFFRAAAEWRAVLILQCFLIWKNMYILKLYSIHYPLW